MAQYTDEDIALMSREEKLDLLDQAKDSYYNTGEELITDAQYDELEAELGLENKNYVGSKHKSYTVQHSFIMGSLSKVQIKEDKKTGIVDWDLFASQINSYLRKSNGNQYIEITPKLDGASFSAEFKNVRGRAKLISCATRGDGRFGTDIKMWFKPMLDTPEWSMIDNACSNLLADDEILCIRGEVLVPNSNFSEKYSDSFTNPRSYVAGRLGLKQSDVSLDMITGSDIHFVCYDYRIVNENDKSFQELDWMNPHDSSYKYLRPYLNHIGELPNPEYCLVIEQKPDDENNENNEIEENDITKLKNKGRLSGLELERIYDVFSKFRMEESEYALDGIVFKPEASARQYNDNKARPEDCVAMKFIPVINATTIIDIEWNVKKTGEYFPKAIIDTIVLDGKDINKASLHNYDYIISNNCGIGSTVRISLAGDIIPFVYEIVNAAGIDDINLPEDSEVYTEPKSGKMHLMKVFNDDFEKEKMRFVASANTLVINGIGPAAASKLWNALHNDIDNLINIVYLMKPDMYRLIYSRLGTSRSTDNIVQGLKDFAQHITLEDVILSFCFKNCGHRASVLCAKIISGDNYSTSGFSSSVYGWAENPNSAEYQMVMDVVNELNIDITPQVSAGNSSAIPVIMTGSPKEFGYSTKKEFIDAHPEYVDAGTDWKICKILFTDDLSSNSGKMKKAIKNGIEIKLYD